MGVAAVELVQTNPVVVVRKQIVKTTNLEKQANSKVLWRGEKPVITSYTLDVAGQFQATSPITLMVIPSPS